MLRRSTVALDSWRSSGITYLQSLAVTSAALQNCVKDSKQAKYGKHSAAVFFAQKPDGQGGFDKVEKIPSSVDNMKQ